MRLIRPLRPFFSGSQTYAADDPPIEFDDHRAAELVRQGLAEYVVALRLPALPSISLALDPAPAAAEQAVSRRQKRA